MINCVPPVEDRVRGLLLMNAAGMSPLAVVNFLPVSDWYLRQHDKMNCRVVESEVAAVSSP